MTNSDDQNIAQLSQGAWIDQVADRFDAEWQSGGQEPQIGSYLAGCSAALRGQLLRELVAVDREYRSKRGTTKSWEEYVAEFPELGDQEPTHASSGGETTQPRPPSTPGTAPVVASAPADPEQIGKYRVLKRLGRGGQATAYLAFDPDLSKSVVLKLSHEAARSGEEDDLRGEGRVLADLSHPHLVRVLHYDLLDGRPYLVMEHIAGQNLAQWAGSARPPQRQAALLVANIAAALAAAHRRGIIHRDLKPANILIDEQGQPRVIDFGLAWHRQGWGEERESDSAIAGTVAYMPPEQARGETDRISPRSDIFGIGGILYFLLTGQSLFQEPGERDFQQVLARARRCSFDVSRLERSGADAALQAICLRALETNPAGRFATADEMAAELLAFAQGGQATRRAAIAVGVAVLGAAGLAAYAFSRRAPLPTVTPPVLSVRVWRDGELQSDWTSAVPLLNERDELQLRWKIPAPLSADLFLINGQGELRPLAENIVGTGGEQFFPASGGRAPLTGPMGTEALLLCCRRSGSPLPTFPWNSREAWPAIPQGSVLRLTPAGLETLQQGRDLGPAHFADDPEAAIRARLERLRAALTKDYHYIEGLVFAHR